MDRVGSLSRLMALSPTDPQFQSERLTLGTSCDDAADKIRQVVEMNKTRYDSGTKARLEKMERELNAVLPPPSEEQQRALKEVVATAWTDVDQFA